MEFAVRHFDDEGARADSQKLMAACFLDATSTSAQFLRWMYCENPAGTALGSLAYERDEPVSQVCVIPQRLERGGESFAAGLVVNVCTLSAHRGRGLLTENIRRARDAARAAGFDLLYGFPNPESYGAFLKVGFDVPREFQLEMMPTNYARLAREALRREKFQTQASTLDLVVNSSGWKSFRLLAADEACGLAAMNDDAAGSSKAADASAESDAWTVPLTCDQLRWRFLSHPTRKYHALRHTPTGALALLRFINLFGLNSCVIMKTTCAEARAFAQLMRDLKRDARCAASFVTAFRTRLTKGRIHVFAGGRFIVPAALAPRRFPLIFLPLRDNLETPGARFELEIGDFDAI